MSKKKVVLPTLIVWLVGTSLYAYWWVTSILADPSTVGYERDPIFPLFGFIVYRGIYLFFGIVIIIWVELMLFETVFRKSQESGHASKSKFYQGCV
jgi:hypothetical protein